VGFVVDEVAAGHLSFWKLQLFPVGITSTVIRVLSLTVSLNGTLKKMKAEQTL
jgi:hypothetical protein